VFVGFAIMLMVYFQLPVIGVLMALGGLITWALVPVFKMTKYLLLEPELHRKRPRAIAFTLALTAAVVILVGLVKFPNNIDQVGVIEPTKKEVIRGRTAGFVTTIGAHPDGRPLKDGDLVKKGQVLWTAVDYKLDAQIEAYKAAQRQNQCIDFTGFHLAQPRVHVPADRHDRKVRPMPQQLGLAAE